MITQEAIKVDEWEIEGKKAEVWIVKGKLQIRAFGVIHNVELKALEENRKLKEAIGKIRNRVQYSCTIGGYVDYSKRELLEIIDKNTEGLI